ncbi:reverse transcriptase [Gossypium australe]|uniref:Reverse transcriptase n=1 Tax=Gossypium australe TaxID=47621 RepID=A0A5B6VIQ6_9ROSI|nr:reverse transcriptase [Gossypium australe]
MGLDDHLFGLVEQKVTESMNANLIKKFTVDEIDHAIKMLAPLHTPGVDGFSTIFFQRFINKTRIVLIPKVEKPKNMSHFRPISLCNVIYKIITKV